MTRCCAKRHLPADFIYRTGTADEWIMKESSYGFVYDNLKADDVVLDVGGYIGTFAATARIEGAGTVYSIEPNPDSYNVLLQNAIKFDFIAVHGAVVPLAALSGRSHVTLTPDADVNRAPYAYVGDLQVNDRKPYSRSINVPAVVWEHVQANLRPTIIKLDVEGAELMLIDTLNLAGLRILAVEYDMKNDQQRARAIATDERLVSSGFRRHTPRPLAEHVGWATVKCYHRDGS